MGRIALRSGIRPSASSTLARGLWILLSIVAGLAGVIWLAIRIPPTPFPPVQVAATPAATVPLRADLPQPVAAYYRQLYGERIPVVTNAVITGRGTMRIPQLLNLSFPVRFRFVLEAARNYRHYIELTLFGMPVLRVNEYYVEGTGRMELPWGVMAGNPKLDQGANLGLWAEILKWTPSVLVTDPAVRWEEIDGESALLIVPFGTSEDRFVVRFNPAYDEIVYWETMRYANGEGEKTLWVNGTWFDDGNPWFIVTEENVVVNVDVDTSVTHKGL